MPKSMTRIIIDVSGYRWRVHGSSSGDKWQTQLIELLEHKRLDIPLDKNLKKKLREEIAKSLNLEVTDVKLTTDLILA